MNTRTFLLLLATLLVTPVHAAQPVPERKLAREGATKLQVCDSMVGFRDTLLFYAFKGQQAVLTIQIGNSDTTFPARATLYLFAPDTSGEAIDKWINNQHSDGLFADAPEPVSEFKLPAGTSTVTDPKVLGEEKRQSIEGEVFVHHNKVKLTVKPYRIDGSFQLEGFADEADIYIKKN